MKAAAIAAFEAGDFEDVAYFEPFYLKDFVAGIPRVKGLR
jgi:tRNA threonylcarbamoyladenosine biosynthesis protein TsaB